MPTAADLSVIIPTLGRWDILERTLVGLDEQTASGFEVIVVSDGAGPLPAATAARPYLRAITQPAGGPGAARNRGVHASTRPLILFLGDDMIPTPELIAAHMVTHDRHPEPEAAVLGLVEWHPEVANRRVNRWLERSATQFDYVNLERERDQSHAVDYEAGFGRFYSCNVSLKRSLFDEVGGFDETFLFYYEDLDLAVRLHQAGLRLLYQPDALARHLHAYNWSALEERFRGIATGEQLMIRAHPEIAPFFFDRVNAATRSGGLSSRARMAEQVLGRIAGWVADHGPHRLRTRAAARQDRAYHRLLAAPFLESWSGARELCELQDYLGAAYEPASLVHHLAGVEHEAESAHDDVTFYRTSQAYLYDLTVFAMSPTKNPYRAEVARLLPAGSSVLDFGCGIGSDGLRLAAVGFDVAFADYDNPSTAYLRWRLQQRSLSSPIYDIERVDIPENFDLVYCFDVIEHVEDPAAFLDRLERLGTVVVINFLSPSEGDTHVHHELDIRALVDRARRRGLLSYRVYHGRSHLVAYRTDGGRSRWASHLTRWMGDGRRHAQRLTRRLRRS